MLAAVTRRLLHYKWGIAADLMALALVSACQYASLPTQAGEYILLTSNEYHWPEDHIFAMLPDGSRLTRLGKGFDPACSPDGRRIAFAAPVGPFLPDGRNPYTQIFVMDADGSNVKQLTFGDDYSDSPTWSPNGQRLAFRENARIAIVDLGSLEVTQLTDLLTYAGDPAWSPDSQQLVFYGHGKPDESGLYVADADGSNLTPLTSGADLEPDWSPDGRYIVFLHVETAVEAMPILRVIEADGSNPVDILPGEPERQSPKWQRSPKWSPDGQRIVFGGSHLLSPKEAGNIAIGEWRDAIYTVSADGYGLEMVIQPSGSVWGWEQGALLPLLRGVMYGKVDWCKVR